MRILFLGSADSPLLEFLKAQKNEVFQTESRLVATEVASQRFDFLVSYGYRYILGRDILSLFPNRAINLHISLLPWNRGADPNLWSFLENTPKGVTIHYLDQGIDTGDILVQKEVEFDPEETLRSSYAKLRHAIEELFRNHWFDIHTGKCRRRPQTLPGSVHRLKDKEPYLHLLTNGWDTPVRALRASRKES